jgi:hypothetical protein
MNRILTAVCGLALFCCTGCTLFRGDSQKVTFATEPTGAALKVDGKSYTAPADVTLKRNQTHDVAASALGYRSVQFKLASKFDGMSLLDLALPGGSVALATDTLTGADKSFTQTVTITLPKADAPDAEPLILHELDGKLITEEQYHDEMIKLDERIKAAHGREQKRVAQD